MNPLLKLVQNINFFINYFCTYVNGLKSVDPSRIHYIVIKYCTLLHQNIIAAME